MTFCFAFLVLWNYNNFDNYLASRLYKIKDDSDCQIDDKYAAKFIDPTKWCNICEFMFDVIPSCLKCKRCKCRKSRKMESVEQARVLMDEEINIVEIIKSRRYFNMALRALLTK